MKSRGRGPRCWIRPIATSVGAMVLIAASVAASAACGRAAAAEPRLVAHAYDSGFADAHDTYNGIGVASDGRVYYVLSSERHDVAAQVFVLDPAVGRPRHVADLDEATGQKGRRAIAQGKSHVNFVEASGRLYFATHIGFYSAVDGMEKMGIPPAGFSPYPGGHLLAYDLATGKIDDLAVAPEREGVLTMNVDARRQRIYALTWPSGQFFRHDIRSRATKTIGRFFEDGENGKGARYRTVCRSLAVDPEDGSVYFTRGEGTILRYRYDRDAVEPVQGDDLKKDYFGQYEAASAGHMAYNWRQTAYRAADRLFYGVHGNSGYLFSFDPRAERVEILERITSAPSRRSGMFDQFSYGYLGFTLGPDGRTLHYLTGGPIYENGRRLAGKSSTAKGESKGAENLHLVTYDIPARRYTDHGPVFYDDGTRPSNVNSIAVGRDGTVYAIARIPRGEGFRVDLIGIKPSPSVPAVSHDLSFRNETRQP
jgi:hypothetical protein